MRRYIPTRTEGGYGVLDLKSGKVVEVGTVEMAVVGAELTEAMTSKKRLFAAGRLQ